MKQTCFLEIKDGDNFLRIDVLKHNFPNAATDSDKNSVDCEISVKAGPFSGVFDAVLMTSNFQTFKDELDVLNGDLDQSATFEGIEQQMRIQVVSDGVEYFTVKSWFVNCAGMGTRLYFEMEIDTREMQPIRRQLENILAHFPVYGKLNHQNLAAEGDYDSFRQRVKTRFNPD